MSYFGGEFTDLGVPELLDKLGDSVTYKPVANLPGGTSLITAIFNEFVGQVDEKGRAIFTVSSTQVPTPRRGDQLTLAGTTWYVIDVRADQAGTFELRCDTSLEDS